MLNYSNIFTNNTDAPRQFKETILASSNKVYRIDDCDLNVTTRGVDTKSSTEGLKKVYSEQGLKHVMGHYSDTISQEIPVMTHEEYLTELRDTVLDAGLINLGNLTRLPIRVSSNTTVCNVIVTGKYPTENVIMNEVFVNDKYVTTYEYSIKELVKACKELIGE